MNTSQCQQLASGARPNARWTAWIDAEKDADHEQGVWRCPEPGEEYAIDAPVDRGRVAAAYCAAHGGRARAERAVRANWLVTAPADVGGVVAVERAGARALSSQHAYIVVRPCHPDQGDGWLAWLGVGGAMQAVGGAPPKLTRGGQVAMRSKGGTLVPRGTHRWPTQEAALAAARAAWARQLNCDVERISRARGGTLDWGAPVEELAAPIELILPASYASAWDAIARGGRVLAIAATGESIVSGAARELGRRGGLAGAGVSGARHKGGEALTPEQRALGQALGVVSRHAGAMEVAIQRARAAGATDVQIERAITRGGPGEGREQ